VAYLGDTAPPGLDVLTDIYKAQILILELTFVAPSERPAVIHKFGHTHLDDLLARAERFENEVIIASHFSTRIHPDQIQRIIERRLPETLRGRLRVWM
jgi:ribonuclease Z